VLADHMIGVRVNLRVGVKQRRAPVAVPAQNSPTGPVPCASSLASVSTGGLRRRWKAIRPHTICCPESDRESAIVPLVVVAVVLKNGKHVHEADVSGLNRRITLSNLPRLVSPALDRIITLCV
jgi:hypothetical protein